MTAPPSSWSRTIRRLAARAQRNVHVIDGQVVDIAAELHMDPELLRAAKPVTPTTPTSA